MAKESRPTRPGFWEEWSLTTKLLAIMMLLMLLVLTGTSAWVLENLRDSLVQRTDESLISASETLAKQAYQDVFQPAELQSAESGDDAEDAPSSTHDRFEFLGSAQEPPAGRLHVQFYNTDGDPIRDPVAPEPQNQPILPKIDEKEVYARAGEPFTVAGTSSQWRARAMKVKNTDVLVSIAVPFDREVDNINERARNTMIGIGPAGSGDGRRRRRIGRSTTRSGRCATSRRPRRGSPPVISRSGCPAIRATRSSGACRRR